MAKAYRETTIWADGTTAINHTYLLEGDQMLGYMRTGTSVPFYFKNPIRISKSGRKFEKLEDNPFDNIFSVVVPQETSSNIKEIDGSKSPRRSGDDRPYHRASQRERASQEATRECAVLCCASERREPALEREVGG